MAKNADSYDLRWARTHTGRTQQEVAALASISRETLSRYETGKHPIPKKRLAQILELLEVSRDEIPEQPAPAPSPVVVEPPAAPSSPLLCDNPDTGDAEADQWLREQNALLGEINALLPSLDKPSRRRVDLDRALQLLEADFNREIPLKKVRTLDYTYWLARTLQVETWIRAAGLWKQFHASGVYQGAVGGREPYERTLAWWEANRPSLV